MEANCWEVCEDLELRVNDAPARSQGFIRCFVSEKREHLFFSRSDTDFLRDIIVVEKSPGRHYYSMVKEFHSLHTERGKYLFMEIQKYDCKTKIAQSVRRVVEEGQ